jgi:hypothetical protein
LEEAVRAEWSAQHRHGIVWGCRFRMRLAVGTRRISVTPRAAASSFGFRVRDIVCRRGGGVVWTRLRRHMYATDVTRGASCSPKSRFSSASISSRLTLPICVCIQFPPSCSRKRACNVSSRRCDWRCLGEPVPSVWDGGTSWTFRFEQSVTSSLKLKHMIGKANPVAGHRFLSLLKHLLSDAFLCLHTTEYYSADVDSESLRHLIWHGRLATPSKASKCTRTQVDSFCPEWDWLGEVARPLCWEHEFMFVSSKEVSFLA